MADTLDKVLKRVFELVPVPQDVQDRVQLDLRQDLGGSEFGYIAKRPALRHAVTMGAQLQAGQSIPQAIQACGLKRRQGYKILGRPAAKPLR